MGGYLTRGEAIAAVEAAARRLGWSGKVGLGKVIIDDGLAGRLGPSRLVIFEVLRAEMPRPVTLRRLVEVMRERGVSAKPDGDLIISHVCQMRKRLKGSGWRIASRRDTTLVGHPLVGYALERVR
jgi:hypothetical protein